LLLRWIDKPRGEQQMPAIDRTIMSKPKLVMFDEPSLGLAPNIVEQVFEIIDGIRKSGTTVLMVEQNAYSVLDMCDDAYLMEAGSIVLSGAGDVLIGDKHI
jgi:branched-chain amino acid transport system ATP-binding protein